LTGELRGADTTWSEADTQREADMQWKDSITQLDHHWTMGVGLKKDLRDSDTAKPYCRIAIA